MSPSPLDRTKFRYMLATQIAIVAAIYTTLIAGILLGQYLTRRPEIPTEASEMVLLKERLAKQPTDETLKMAIRELDRELRETYFTDRDFISFGGGLLLLSAIVFLISTQIALAAKTKLPCPDTVEIQIDRQSKEFATARAWVIGVAAVLLIGTVVAAILAERHLAGLHRALEIATHLEEEKPSPTSDNTVSEPIATNEDFSTAVDIVPGWTEAWPRFRGPDGSGHSAYENLPTTWDAKTGKNLLWKTEVPLPGNSSPIVWKDRLFLTGADEKQRKVFCFDTSNGKMLWEKEVPGTKESTSTETEAWEDTGFAAPSPTTDGQRVFAMFANGDVGAFDFDGKLLWHRSLGIPDNVYCHATSPVLGPGRLLIQFDQGTSDDDKSRLLALDVKTGDTLWETKRKVPNSWATPLVVKLGSSWQIITTADPWVIAYNVTNGRELWRVKCLSGDQGVSPVIADGLLQVGNKYCQKWQAIRLEPNLSGTLPEKSTVWSKEADNLPDPVSPIVVDGLLLLTSPEGTVTCYDAASGETLWKEKFESEFTSSPGAAGKQVYYIGKEGNGWVIEPTREGCKRLGETNLGEPCVTSPAFQDGRIYLRGENHIFCIGAADGSS